MTRTLGRVGNHEIRRGSRIWLVEFGSGYRWVTTAQDGADIGSGVTDLGQFFTRPTWRAYATPARGLYICSASTPPGVGVHGMCGYFAARLALKQVLRD